MNKDAGLLKRLARDKAGNTLAIAAVALVPLTAMAGGALDMSVAYMARAKLQNACDAAALAGRQSMEGASWTDADLAEAEKYFGFNFPEDTHGAQNLSFTIEPNEEDPTELLGYASAKIPTSLMRMFGKETIDISVTCDAKKDQGHNDIVLVLDVTGSMASRPSGGGWETKIQRLRSGAVGLYNALAGDGNSITRFGIVPYSMTVNVARQLDNNDLVTSQKYVEEFTFYEVRESRWDGWRRMPDNWRPTNRDYRNFYDIQERSEPRANGKVVTMNPQQKTAFRTGGNGCIEERPSFGNSPEPVRYNDSVVLGDVDEVAGGEALRFGRYSPSDMDGESSSVCVAEASPLQVYDTAEEYNDAIDAATATVSGNTYHDLGMLWGTRWISRNGLFADTNPEDWNGIPIHKHIVFMTDGILSTNGSAYTSYGIDNIENRANRSGSLSQFHQRRFIDTCNVAKSMGVTIWVIALDDENAARDVEDCATSAAHFKTSDGSDLEEVFSEIGQGIGTLRLTK